MDPVPVKEGMLQLCTRGLLKTKKEQKWCILYRKEENNPSRLEAYDDKEQAVHKQNRKSFPLNNVKSIEKTVKSSKTSRDFHIDIISKREKFQLAFESEKELSNWMCALNSVVDIVESDGQSDSIGSNDFRPNLCDDDDDEEIISDNIMYEKVDKIAQKPVVHEVEILPSEGAERMKLFGRHLLYITEQDLQLVDFSTQKPILVWPYRYIRRYGQKKGQVIIVAGRHCPSGEGDFNLGTSQYIEIHNVIKERATKLHASSDSADPSTPEDPCLENKPTYGLYERSQSEDTALMDRSSIGHNRLTSQNSGEPKPRAPLPDTIPKKSPVLVQRKPPPREPRVPDTVVAINQQTQKAKCDDEKRSKVKTDSYSHVSKENGLKRHSSPVLPHKGVSSSSAGNVNTSKSFHEMKCVGEEFIEELDHKLSGRPPVAMLNPLMSDDKQEKRKQEKKDEKKQKEVHTEKREEKEENEKDVRKKDSKQKSDKLKDGRPDSGKTKTWFKFGKQKEKKDEKDRKKSRDESRQVQQKEETHSKRNEISVNLYEEVDPQPEPTKSTKSGEKPAAFHHEEPLYDEADFNPAQRPTQHCMPNIANRTSGQALENDYVVEPFQSSANSQERVEYAMPSKRSSAWKEFGQESDNIHLEDYDKIQMAAKTAQEEEDLYDLPGEGDLAQAQSDVCDEDDTYNRLVLKPGGKKPQPPRPRSNGEAGKVELPSHIYGVGIQLDGGDSNYIYEDDTYTYDDTSLSQSEDTKAPVEKMIESYDYEETSIPSNAPQKASAAGNEYEVSQLKPSVTTKSAFIVRKADRNRVYDEVMESESERL